MPFHPLEVRASEHKVYRLFAIDLATHHIPAFTRPKTNNIGDPEYPLCSALGLAHLDEQHVQILRLSDLGEMKLTDYMQEGLGISKADLVDHTERLNALEGHLAVVASAAFEGPAMITPKLPVSLVGAFAEHEAMTGFVDLSSTSATSMLDLRENLPGQARDRRAWLHWLWPCIGVAVIAYALYLIFFAGEAP